MSCAWNRLQTGKSWAQNQGSLGELFNYHCLLQCKSDAKRRPTAVTPAGVLTATDRTFKCFLGKIASVFFWWKSGSVGILDGTAFAPHCSMRCVCSLLCLIYSLCWVLVKKEKKIHHHSGDAVHSPKLCQLHGWTCLTLASFSSSA